MLIVSIAKKLICRDCLLFCFDCANGTSEYDCYCKDCNKTIIKLDCEYHT